MRLWGAAAAKEIPLDRDFFFPSLESEQKGRQLNVIIWYPRGTSLKAFRPDACRSWVMVTLEGRRRSIRCPVVKLFRTLAFETHFIRPCARESNTHWRSHLSVLVWTFFLPLELNVSCYDFFVCLMKLLRTLPEPLDSRRRWSMRWEKRRAFVRREKFSAKGHERLQ